MTDKVQKNRIADILLDFYDEYDSNVINRPMIPNIYAGKILNSLQEEPVSEDLEEVAHKYADGENPTCPCEECLIKTFKAGAKWQKEKEYTCYEEAFEDGAKWKKKQMIKDAISAKVTEIYYPTDSCLEIEATLPESRFKDGDKVLIIKKD